MPTPYRVAALIGSLRKDSLNRKLATALAGLSPPELVLQHVRIDDLPLFNPDHEQNPPEPAARVKREIEAADALLFVTPEYNRSIPGVLKNAIDTASRPYGRNSFAKKPGGVIGISTGAVGTAVAQQHLRTILAYLDVPTLGQPEAFIQFKDGLIAEGGEVTDENRRKFLQNWIDRFAEWVKRFAAPR